MKDSPERLQGRLEQAERVREDEDRAMGIIDSEKQGKIGKK